MVMTNRIQFLGLFVGFLLAGCSTSSAQTPSDDAARQDGLARVAAADTEGGSCLESCGLEARSGVYTDCLAQDKAQRACGKAARGWYRECIESRCSDDELRIDDCRVECRTTGAAARKVCVADDPDAESCQTDARAATKACVEACG